jgi:molybdopterin molybdotransferase
MFGSLLATGGGHDAGLAFAPALLHLNPLDERPGVKDLAEHADTPEGARSGAGPDDCCSGHSGPALPVAAARERLLALVQPVQGSETLPLAALPGRVLAEAVSSPIAVPGADNSAMDGYALRAADIADDAQLEVIATIYAGHPFDGHVGPGQAVRIFTGAPVPKGADTVVMQEHVTPGEVGRIGLSRLPRAGDNIRPAGEDIPLGAAVMGPGTLLRAAEIGVLASIGRDRAQVFRRPRVAVMATGDELVPPGQPLAPGQIHDSNSATLGAMLWRLGVEVVDLGRVGDDPQTLERVFREAAAHCDAIITSGGVSVGDADHVMPTLKRIGELHLWKIAMRPGRPLAFGRIDGCWFFGLPGNPVSVMATFHQVVQPALQRMMGMTPRPPLTLRARLLGALRKKPGRTEFSRGLLDHDDQGRLVVASAGRQGSGILSSMIRANCFIVVPQDSGSLEDGAEVDVQPFDGFVW